MDLLFQRMVFAFDFQINVRHLTAARNDVFAQFPPLPIGEPLAQQFGNDGAAPARLDSLFETVNGFTGQCVGALSQAHKKMPSSPPGDTIRLVLPQCQYEIRPEGVIASALPPPANMRSRPPVPVYSVASPVLPA